MTATCPYLEILEQFEIGLWGLTMDVVAEFAGEPAGVVQAVSLRMAAILATRAVLVCGSNSPEDFGKMMLIELEETRERFARERADLGEPPVSDRLQ